MSDTDDDDTGTRDERIVNEAHRRFDRCVRWESDTRINARKDAIFANGDAYNMGQWDSTVMAARAGRPCLTVNKVRQHNLQVINDGRQHKSQIKVMPSGGGATYEAAQVYSACIRRIEAQSKATDAYNTAAYHQVETGIGYCRVVTRFADDESMDQEIFIDRVSNPASVYLDPDARDYDKADMRFAFIFSDMERGEFIAEYGREAVTSSSPLDERGVSSAWESKDHVRVAEYFRRRDHDDQLHQMHDGTVLRESLMPKGWARENKGAIRRSRPITRPEVEWFKLAGSEIIERKPVACKYIPIVPWIGEEVVIDGRMDRRGHTRALIDPQRIYDYATSSAAEFIGLQTKTPYIASAQSIEGYETDWENANTSNKAVLLYNSIDDAGHELPRPEREKPPVAAPAYLELMKTAQQEMMMASGQYQENFGEQSNAHSGVAINAREREGSNATFHYIDNGAKGVRQVGRICQDMIPRIYDVARVIKIMAEDGTQSDVHVDPSMQAAHQHVVDGPNGPQPIDADQAKEADNDPSTPDVRVIFNPGVGSYDVTVDVGPPFATQREEAANAFTQIMANHPDAFAIVGDFWAKNSDFPGSNELAERLKRGIPKQYQSGPPPEVAQLQQQLAQVTQHGQQIAMQADQHIMALKQEIDGMRSASKDQRGRISVQDYQAETQRLQAVTAADPAAAKVLVRTMLSGLLGMPALPIMQAHDAADAEHAQSIAPPDPDASPQQEAA